MPTTDIVQADLEATAAVMVTTQATKKT